MRKVFFMHIPKTGGGTFENAIAPHMYNPAPRMSYEDAQEFDFSDCDWIAGHYPAGFMDRLPEDTIKVTILRDPVARVLSHYAYLHEHGVWTEEKYSKFCKGATLEEWLVDERSGDDSINVIAKMFDIQRMIKDRKYKKPGIHRFPGDDVAMFDVIGFVNEPNGLQRACDWLFKLLDRAPPVVQGTYNASNTGILLSELKLETLAEIQERTWADLSLYKAALKWRDERMGEG